MGLATQEGGREQCRRLRVKSICPNKAPRKAWSGRQQAAEPVFTNVKFLRTPNSSAQDTDIRRYDSRGKTLRNQLTVRVLRELLHAPIQRSNIAAEVNKYKLCMVSMPAVKESVPTIAERV